MALPRPSADTTVVVTGAASGIGKEVARELAARGYNLVLADLQDAVQDAADELRGNGIEIDVHQLDLTDAEARAKFIDAVLHGPHAVIGVANVAGLISVGRFDALPLARERVLVDVSVSALHHLTGAFLPGMRARGAGAIMNVASPAGVSPLPYMASYSAAKSFVIYFSTALHSELAGSGVSCTTFVPGITKTPLAYGIEETKYLPGWVWNLPFFHEPQGTARRAVEGMLKGSKLASAGPDAWFVTVVPRYLPPSLAQPIIRFLGKFLFASR
ncbi:SDR family NAD(P)-dependent oxidoreductase [Nocardia uniformis]|uniref:SDR family NAD(P)-dependent oxidoreductase n=1 Tax=Nocardia uniformis TaxID=53432 RepID=A0A849CCZ9_9NOCA|nr:SDR family NAD(P)-dependent oxidoreductase [Nocardia uniformis]NNH70921.1 SDR family NAD(P)-dependent oxidoreductase [Nocardia uniformis]